MTSVSLYIIWIYIYGKWRGVQNLHPSSVRNNNEQIKYMIKHTRYQSHNENIAIYRILFSNEMLQKQEKSCEHP